MATDDDNVTRRNAMARAGGVGAAALVGRGLAAAEPAGEGGRAYRVGVIGHTGRGNYGHGLDVVWRDVPGSRVVAVADANEKGRAAAVKRLKAEKGYADYRRMLDEVKPDLVSVCPRWMDQKRDMVVAAAERGVKGIYMEKPMCPTLVEADEMAAACRKHKVQLVISHQTRYSPRIAVVRELVKSGRIGRVLEIRARGKEDRRGGGEDLWVLGTHVLNLMHVFGGPAVSCYGTVRQGGRPVVAKDVHDGAEGIGPLAGDEVHAIYRLGGREDTGVPAGTVAYFDSIRGMGGRGGRSRYVTWLYGSKGIIEIGHGSLPPVFLLDDASWSPPRSGAPWVPVTSTGVGKPEPLKDAGHHASNVLACRDLIRAVETGQPPLGNLDEAVMATEMIVSVFESHRLGRAVSVPLKNRRNPLTMLT